MTGGAAVPGVRIPRAGDVEYPRFEYVLVEYAGGAVMAGVVAAGGRAMPGR